MMRDTIGLGALAPAAAAFMAGLLASAAGAAEFYKVGDKNLPQAEAAADTGAPSSIQIDTQAVLAMQTELVREAVAGLAEERRGETDVYAVLLAGDPDNPVYFDEIERVGGILRNRFDTGDRQVQLANSAIEPDRYPLATAENLGLVLEGVARQMNPLEDVLFLYLVSGGGPERLDAAFPALSTEDITAEQVSDGLDAAGIRQAIIAISACNSGSFLPFLERPTYVVMAGSAADAAECAEATEWTWFGRALFEVGFEATPDPRVAFEDAKGWLETQAEEKDLAPAAPEIRVGAEATRFLDRLANPDAR